MGDKRVRLISKTYQTGIQMPACTSAIAFAPPSRSYVGEVLEEEHAALCGSALSARASTAGDRASSAASSLTLRDRQVRIGCPRARSIGGHEMTLPSWRAWSSRDPLNERAFEQIELGVSTQRYARAL